MAFQVRFSAHLVRVGVAASADDVVDARAVLIPAVPLQCVVGDGGHWPGKSFEATIAFSWDLCIS